MLGKPPFDPFGAGGRVDFLPRLDVHPELKGQAIGNLFCAGAHLDEVDEHVVRRAIRVVAELLDQQKSILFGGKSDERRCFDFGPIRNRFGF